MMKIDRIQTTMVLTVIMMMCFLLMGSGKSNAFDGTRTSDEAEFWMEYRILDKEESSDLTLSEGKISFVCPQKRDREIKARLEECCTDYIGDAPQVVGIASNLPYQEGFSYRSIEIQSDTEPYELTVFLDGEGNASESDFENAAKLAFDYIKNMGTIRFCMEEAKEEVASFER